MCGLQLSFGISIAEINVCGMTKCGINMCGIEILTMCICLYYSPFVSNCLSECFCYLIFSFSFSSFYLLILYFYLFSSVPRKQFLLRLNIFKIWPTYFASMCFFLFLLLIFVRMRIQFQNLFLCYLISVLA